MYDYHLHSSISFDSTAEPFVIALAAKAAGLHEICFTDHYAYNSDPSIPPKLFSVEQYRTAYERLQVPGLAIHRGVEFGLTRGNKPQLEEVYHCLQIIFGVSRSWAAKL